METNSLDYFTIKSTLDELTKIGKTEIVNNLLDILNYNNLAKPEKHNRQNDITTTYYKIELSSEYLDEIIDLFLDLEISSLSKNGESTNSTNHYVNLLDKWLKIKEAI